MDEWFSNIAAQTTLDPLTLETLKTNGFVLIPGPVPNAELAKLASAYDHAVLQADPGDIGIGSSTARVHDFVNRGAEFDSLYVHLPVLEASCRVIGSPIKLSSLSARTLNPEKPAQRLHVDFTADENGWPMVRFIFMVDEFRPENGATYFLPGSQGDTNPCHVNESLVQACGPAGSMIVYNGSIWHGHAANLTKSPRRSIQGAYIRRTEVSSINFSAKMRADTLKRISPLAKYILGL